jgi:hypothetical protein
MHSRDGFSGSPVFVYRTLGAVLGVPEIKAQTLLYVLGIHWAQFPEAWDIVTKPKERKTEVKSEVSIEGDEKMVMGLSGMTCVAPASAILKLLEHPKLRAHHDQMSALAKQKKAHDALLGTASLEFTGPAFADAGASAAVPPEGPDPEKP